MPHPMTLTEYLEKVGELTHKEKQLVIKTWLVAYVSGWFGELTLTEEQWEKELTQNEIPTDDLK